MGQYKSQYTGPQIDAGVDAALNPDVSVTPDSDALVTSGAVADALDNIDPTITGNTDTTLNGILVGNGSKVGTKSLDTSLLTNDADHVPASSVVKSAITKVETDLASIHATGPTNTTGAAIATGTYFYLAPQSGDDEILVQAKANIAVNATFTSGTNYETPTAGALNALKSALRLGAARAEFTHSIAANSDWSWNLSDIATKLGISSSKILAVIVEGVRPAVSWAEVRPVYYYNANANPPNWGVHNYGTGGNAIFDYNVIYYLD